LPRGCVLPGTFTCYSCLCPRNHRISMNYCRTSSYRFLPVRVRLRPLFDAHCHRSNVDVRGGLFYSPAIPYLRTREQLGLNHQECLIISTELTGKYHVRVDARIKSIIVWLSLGFVLFFRTKYRYIFRRKLML
jgi:hypothetical protein